MQFLIFTLFRSDYRTRLRSPRSTIVFTITKNYLSKIYRKPENGTCLIEYLLSGICKWPLKSRFREMSQYLMVQDHFDKHVSAPAGALSMFLPLFIDASDNHDSASIL